MAINTLKDLRRLNKSYEYFSLDSFGLNESIIVTYGHDHCVIPQKIKGNIKEIARYWRSYFLISRKEYIVLVVDSDMYDKLQSYTYSYVYTVQELFRKEKVIVDKIRNGNIYTFFTLDKYKWL